MSEKVELSEYSAELFGIGGKPTKKEKLAIVKKLKQEIQGGEKRNE